MNILFLTNVLPFQRRNGGEVCSSRLLARLCDISARVLVVGRGDSVGTPEMPQLEVRSLAPPATEFAKMTVTEKLLSLAGATTSGESWTAHRMGSGVMQALNRTIGDETFDYVFVDHLQIYKWYRALGLKVPTVLVAHNVEHQVYDDLLKRSSGIAARWVLERERELLYRLDEAVLRDIGTVACLTEEDKAYYVGLAHKIGANATVEILPSYFEGDLGARQSSTEVESTGPRRIGILGTWTWESNRLGVEWFLREVLPHIDGECEVVIAGRGLQIGQLPARVRYLGFVESAELFYQSSDVIAIPSIAGGGVQEKTIEAIGYGVPVVATTVAVRGIQPCPSHVQVVRTPSEFAAACCRRQILDAIQAQIEVCAWNVERRLQYVSAIDKLLAVATHRSSERNSKYPKVD